MIRTPLARLAIVLGVVLVLDLGATAAVYVDRRDDPLVPEFTRADLSRVNWRVDTYHDPAPVLGLATYVPSPGHALKSGRVDFPGPRVRPDASLRYSLGALAAYDESGDIVWLRRASVAAGQVLRTTRNGFVPHQFPTSDAFGRGIAGPWYAAETQGLMLSTLARLYEKTGNDRWLEPADEVFGSLAAFRGYFSGSMPAPTNWLATVNADGYLWFDRYSTGLETTASLTEQIWTALGIYDYRRVLATSPDTQDTATKLLAGAVATIEHHLPRFRTPGMLSISNLATGGRNTRTHFVVKEQLKLLGRVTGNKTIRRYERLFDHDDDLPYFATQPLTMSRSVETYSSVPERIAASPAAARPSRVTTAGKPSRLARVVDPTENADFAIACMVRYQRTGDRAWFSLARRAVDEAMATAVNGALPHRYGGRDVWGNRLEVPWYSARTQGLMLSALSLLYEAGGGNARLLQARQVFSALTRVQDYGYPPPQPWISIVDGQGYLWFEQLADGNETSLLVQGHLTALLGIYDYWRITRSPAAREYFAGGIATIRHVLPELRAPNSIMLASPRVHTRDPRAHPVITRQIDMLARITGDYLLTRYARLLAKDLDAVRAGRACPAEETCSG